MEYRVFPNEKKEEIFAKAAQKKRIVDQKSDSEIGKIKNETHEQNERASKLLKAPSSTWDFIVEFGVAGLCIGFSAPGRRSPEFPGTAPHTPYGHKGASAL